MTNEKLTIKDLDKLLSRHDWYYAFSDDHSYWTRGEAGWEEIQRVQKELASRDADRLVQAYRDIYFSPARGFDYTYPEGT